jgi:transcriptional regulator with XRE-family HTH domain
MFDKQLHDTRIKSGYTAQQMADWLGISLRAYRFYESGSREPNLSTLSKIADILGVTTDYLLDRDEHLKAPGVSADE